MSDAHGLGSLHPEERQKLKRMAVNVVSLLPEDESYALLVLDYARELITDFLGKPEPVVLPVIPLGSNVIPITSAS